jgi:tetratricopeptide (TPR) repeat protein
MGAMSVSHSSSGFKRQANGRARLLLSAVGLACGLLASGVATAADVDEQYRQGLYLRETGQPYSAIESLDSLLAANPGLNRVRLELAVAYYRTLNYAKAKEHAQRVLDDPKTPDAVRLSVLSFLKNIELEQRAASANANKFEPAVSVGLFFDSNVNAGPDTAVLGNGLVLNDGSLAKPDWGYLAQASLTQSWQSASPVRVGEQTARFGWTSQFSGYQKTYKQYGEFDLGVLSVATGPTIVADKLGRANLNMQLDYLTLGGETLGTFTSLAPSFTTRIGRDGELTVDGQWMYRNYSRAIDDGRNSHERTIGLSYGHLFLEGRLALQGGYKAFWEDAVQDRFSNQGEEVFVGGRYRAWQGGDLFARSAWRFSDFQGAEPTFDVARHELEQRLELGVSHQFQSGWLNKWQFATTLTRVTNKANLSLYAYTRDTVFFTLGRSF